MQIKLTMDLPINEACGAFEGKEFTVTGTKLKKDRVFLFYFKGENGDKCGAYHHECEVVKKP